MEVREAVGPMLDLFDLIRVLIIPLLLGMGLLRSMGIGVRSDPLAWPGLAWIVGSLATALLVFLWLFLGPLPASPRLPEALALVLALLSWSYGKRFVPMAAPPRPRQVASWENILFGTVLALLILLVCARIIDATLFPVLIGDEADHWGMKTQILWESGGFTDAWKAAMADPHSVYHKDYPLLNPLLQIWVHAHAGQFVHVANRLPIQLFSLAGLLVLASGLYRLLRPTAAALLLCLAVAPGWSQIQARSGDADFMVGLGALVAFVFAIRGQRTRQAAWTRMAFVGLAFMLWSKNESQLYLLSLLGAGIVWAALQPRRIRSAIRWNRAWIWALVPFGILLIHHGFNLHYGIVSTFSKHEEGNLLTLLLENLGQNGPAVLSYFSGQVFFRPDHSNLLFPLMLVLLIAYRQKIFHRSHLALPALALLLAMLGILCVLIASPVDVHWLLATAAQRVSFQLYFCWIFWIALAVHDLRVTPALSPRPLAT